MKFLQDVHTFRIVLIFFYFKSKTAYLYLAICRVCVSVCVCEGYSFVYSRKCNRMCRLCQVVCVLWCVCNSCLLNPLCLASRWQRNRTNSTGTITMRASWSVSRGRRRVCVRLCSLGVSWRCFRCRPSSLVSNSPVSDWNGQKMRATWGDLGWSSSMMNHV